MLESRFSFVAMKALADGVLFEVVANYHPVTGHLREPT